MTIHQPLPSTTHLVLPIVAWMIGAFLPLPPNPYMASKGDAGRPDIEEAMTRVLGPIDEAKYENARWWRALNRILSAVGLIIIIAVVRLQPIHTELWLTYHEDRLGCRCFPSAIAKVLLHMQCPFRPAFQRLLSHMATSQWPFTLFRNLSPQCLKLSSYCFDSTSVTPRYPPVMDLIYDIRSIYVHDIQSVSFTTIYYLHFLKTINDFSFLNL